MKKSLVSISIALSSLASSVAQAENQKPANGIGLNIYCDPIDSVYLGGSPLFDEVSGELQDRAEYLASKALNEFCDPIDSVYLGGSPLFDEISGESISLEDYLARKEWTRGPRRPL